MASPDVVPFFTASIGAAAALLGLLFVAVSISPERTVGRSAPIERQAAADSIFTAMVDAFFVSMGGAIPGAGLGSIALTLSAIALSHTLFQGWRLWPRPYSFRGAARRLGLVLVGTVIYSLQLRGALQLLASPGGFAGVAGQINVLFAIYGFSMVRSWQLLGASRGLINSLLVPLFDPHADEAADSREPAIEDGDAERRSQR